MSSREIAELTGKRHTHVIADIRKMFKQLEITEPKFRSSYRDATGKSNIEYKLPRRETMILMMGYRIDLRAKVYDRWEELEEKERSGLMTLPNFSDPAAAARAWADELEERRAGLLAPSDSLRAILMDAWSRCLGCRAALCGLLRVT